MKQLNLFEDVHIVGKEKEISFNENSEADNFPNRPYRNRMGYILSWEEPEYLTTH